MKFKIPDNIRVFLSSKYLNWAENLPEFGGSFIAFLQHIRKDKRRQSEDEHKRSRSPEGTEIEYLYFRLIEMFHFEEFRKVEEGLIRLFPGLQGNKIKNENFSTFFERFADPIDTGGMQEIGYIFRELKKRGFFPFNILRVMKNLPQDVDHIVVNLHKFLPSLIVISFDIYLTNKSTEYLVNLQKKYYLPRLRLNNLIPWKIKDGYSEESAETVRIEDILGWIENLRNGVEKCIKPFLNGYFMQQNYEKKSWLPAIEVYGIKGKRRRKFSNLEEGCVLLECIIRVQIL